MYDAAPLFKTRRLKRTLSPTSDNVKFRMEKYFIHAQGLHHLKVIGVKSLILLFLFFVKYQAYA